MTKQRKTFQGVVDVPIRVPKYTTTVTWEQEEEEKTVIQGDIDKIKNMARKLFSCFILPKISRLHEKVKYTFLWDKPMF